MTVTDLEPVSKDGAKVASSGAPASRPARGRATIGPALRTVLGWVAILALWEYVARGPLDQKHLIAAPTAMAVDIVEKADLYWRALMFTGSEALWGYLWGNLAAVLLAVIVAVVPMSERFVMRVALVVYCLPLVALGPLLRLVWGLGEGPQITLAAIAVFYMTLVPLLVGLRAVPTHWVDLVESYGRGRYAVLVTVRLRACVPYLAAGMQVAVPAAFLGALVGEFTGAEQGMGVLSILALRSLDTDGLWALSAINAAVSIIGYVFVGWLGRRLTVHQPTVLMSPPPAQSARRPWYLRVAATCVEGVLTVLAVVVGWVAFLRIFDLNPYFAKTPAQVWEYLAVSPTSAADRAEILDALWSTASVATPGYLAGLALGVGTAAAFQLMPAVRRTMTPIAVALRCVPIIAIAPLLVQALGRGGVGTTSVVALMTFFPTLVSSMYGLRQAPGQVTDFFEVFATPAWRTLLLARVPAMMPAFFSAARIAAPSAILAATVAEWLATGTGIGNLMSVTAATSKYDALWATVVVVTIAAFVAYWVIEVVERLVLARVAPEQRW